MNGVPVYPVTDPTEDGYVPFGAWIVIVAAVEDFEVPATVTGYTIGV